MIILLSNVMIIKMTHLQRLNYETNSDATWREYCRMYDKGKSAYADIDRPYHLTRMDCEGNWYFDEFDLQELYHLMIQVDGMRSFEHFAFGTFTVMSWNENFSPEQIVKLVIDCDKKDNTDLSFTIEQYHDYITALIGKVTNLVFSNINAEITPLYNTESKNGRYYLLNVTLKQKHRFMFHELLNQHNTDEDIKSKIKFDSTTVLRTIYSNKPSKNNREKDENKKGSFEYQIGKYVPKDGNKSENLMKFSVYDFTGKVSEMNESYKTNFDELWVKRIELKGMIALGIDRSTFPKIDPPELFNEIVLGIDPVKRMVG
jgi:hypothetical protein